MIAPNTKNFTWNLTLTEYEILITHSGDLPVAAILREAVLERLKNQAPVLAMRWAKAGEACPGRQIAIDNGKYAAKLKKGSR